MSAVISSRVYATSLQMSSTPGASSSLPAPSASTPRPIPNANANATLAAQLYPRFAEQQLQLSRPSTKVNLAEEEDAGDYKAGGYHPVHIMDSFSNGRYLILRKMGWGHFSTVWLAKDNQDNKHVALKIMKSSRRYTETALDEIKLLRTLKAANPGHPGYANVVSFLDSFEHMGVHNQAHVCMTFEPLGENLLSLTQRCVKENKLAVAALTKGRRPQSSTSSSKRLDPTYASLIDLAVPPALVKSIAKQILQGMDYLHSECGLIHTDLKPENVLVALEDVEEVVRMELEMFPTSESIKASTLTHITFPPSHNPRPNSPSSLHHQSLASSNQVYIFSSQPLSSPSRTPIGSLSSSPMDRLAMRMTALGLTSKADADAPKMPSSMEVGMGAPTTALESAIATATIASGPNQTSASALIAIKNGVVDLTEEEAAVASMSSSLNTTESTFSLPVTPTTDGGENEKIGAHPIPVIVRTSSGLLVPRELSICDDRTETGTVVDDVPSSFTITREATPLAGKDTSAPSLLSQTAPKAQQTPAREEDARPPLIRVKIADLGNATPISHHFTNDIQTRQYRSPEAILGMEEWDQRVDMWSVACVVFELLTGEYLFNPKSRQGCWGKDDDHVAQIAELLGDGFPREMKTNGKWSREIWRSNGALRHIARLNYWPIASVMGDKYDYNPEQAQLFASFMEPMLTVDWKQRANAKDMLDHPWLRS